MTDLYGSGHRLCVTPNPNLELVLSQARPIDLIELEALGLALGELIASRTAK
jgi:hypothetical protein